ncbi:type II secretion system inner membrane protein GspF [Shewanella frigidimarina]|jgi:general secretion pathway protein F|uniref:General secretion pathway protein F n=1 Tax=Shewanella frigidimarina (strain NCIMB 400) TaxID=318167 RepID=Q089U5_SHEFN|nr:MULTISPECIES: type II secretion system inner membrane protein GspF [Shewanella]MBB1380647.1 type II secretion system inner membrane protein GspF [Shewanella sp. SR41-2]ABI69970.1 general secretion pathway protein F [Shewanella frigidimarina NCIMB 400]MBB1427278.1 type II secretion system inner membrane protein GspF [Shewanella sp. SG44-2]PKI07671.1 type II secretion system protein GspF [Shewanella sp. 11B5]RPA27699.1 type II secretion system protein GspF [Shewanella frigidimarina]|tara:strand:- start:17955 stop:19187 length:1233 start_codon:yes stop_codon:yes gene_type:complete
MAAFEYKALDSKGKQQKGVIEADTARHARSQLREQRLMPLELQPVSEKEARSQRGGFNLANLFKKRISVAELALITRQIATLVAAGLPIEEALKAVGQQSEKDRLGSMIMAVRSRVVEGYSLADSMAEFPHVFDDLYRAMVASGEKSGHLEVVLNRLADYTERRQQLKSKLTQAMIYPIVLTVVAIGVIAVLLAAVVPKVVGQFEHMGQELPGTTQFLILASDFVQHWGVVVVLLIFAAMVMFQRLLTNPIMRMKYDTALLQMPVIGKVSKGLNTARFARTLSILSASSVPLLDGMRIASEVLQNVKVRAAVDEATARVREGTSLGTALTNTKLFPAMMLYMIASGEKSGQLENMLERAADNQDREFESNVNIALGVFEPMLVVSMASVVLFIVMAILQPILELNNLISG